MEKNTSVPEEALVKILTNLPTKTLTRFKSVSKSWKSLLQTSFFANQHIKLLESSPNYKTKSKFIYSLDFKKAVTSKIINDDKIIDVDWTDFFSRLVEIDIYRHHKIDICSNVDGIYSVVWKLQHSSIATTDISLWNPAIRQIYTLPKLGHPIRIRENPSIFHVFKSVLECVGFGFGRERDYKVVVVVSYNSYDDFDSCVQVFDLKTNTWREVDFEKITSVYPAVMNVGKKDGPVIIRPYGGFHFNGACHWFCYHRIGEYRCVLAFHFDSELFREFELPSGVSDESVYQITNVDDHLAIVCVEKDENVTRAPGSSHGFDVWLMVEYGDGTSWLKVYNVVTERFDRFFGLVGDEIFIEQRGTKKLVSYPMRTESKGRFVDDEWCVPEECRILPYCESLVHVKPLEEDICDDN